ncbi:uncharacterized protein N7459_000537 [Penicillium hispanicum]|uniref:uncharacterized protein n=1 Tax=Penicillium hispanicum TaxID=1080232 RepID=UPI0025414EAA|nr:uncharacterized protein N7459_000537 [Penicillium hispanicum]KAJ5594329.1 hypothetical protein N7459_000537 [Penicillium hispanicum]
MRPQQLLTTLILALPLVAADSERDRLGCYATVPDLTSLSVYTFQSTGYCIDKCSQDAYRYAALTGNKCGCSNSAPAESAKLSETKCNTECAGFPEDKCGGDDAYTVLTTGEYSAVDGSVSDDSSSSKGDEKSTTTGTATGGGAVVVTNVNPSAIPTAILTAASGSAATKTSSSSVAGKTAGSSSAATGVTSTVSPSTTANAADVLRAGPVAGALVAGLGLLLL